MHAEGPKRSHWGWRSSASRARRALRAQALLLALAIIVAIQLAAVGIGAARGGRGDVIRAGPGNRVLIGGKHWILYGGRGIDYFNVIGDGQQVGRGRDVIHARNGRLDVINCGGRGIAYVDRAEDGVFDCRRVIFPR